MRLRPRKVGGNPVHPHSRGENGLRNGETRTLIGFIPTRAGKIFNPDQRLLSSWVHPHSRGENVELMVSRTSCLGSSPLARGKSSMSNHGVMKEGFIPTRAGKILPREILGRPSPVHPHSRGENKSANRGNAPHDGSSPLARGKWDPRLEQPTILGFIPTRAGKIRPAPAR